MQDAIRVLYVYITNAYFLQMAARGERNIESNQFAIDVSPCTLSPPPAGIGLDKTL